MRFSELFGWSGAELFECAPEGLMCEDDFEVEEFAEYPVPSAVLVCGCPGSTQGLKFKYNATMIEG